MGMRRLLALRGHLVVLLFHLTALAATVWWLRSPPPGAVEVQPPPTVVAGPTPSAAPIVVYVSGAVAHPDVVRLTVGARAAAAVAAAGGLTSAADPAAVNLAAPVADGDHVHIPNRGETAGPLTAVAAPLAAGARPAAGPTAGQSANSTSRLDLNAATPAELEALPGIGPALAGRIVDYRGSHGPFRDVRELLNVSGVGEKTLARFADQLTVR
jgi:competence protein ComEA